MHPTRETLKIQALALRKRGASLRDVELRLGIARSTLSYWFRGIILAQQYQDRLQKRHNNALINARKEAVKWHNAQKTARLALAKQEAAHTLEKIDFQSRTVVELALAILYLGEGTKKAVITSMGNSDPLILRFFVEALHWLYRVPRADMRCELHLRADQNAAAAIRYWSRELGIRAANFSKPSIDKRTLGRPTYPHYKGVCIVRCSRVAIQRKLMYIATAFCETSANGMRG